MMTGVIVYHVGKESLDDTIKINVGSRSMVTLD